VVLDGADERQWAMCTHTHTCKNVKWDFVLR